jgi:demethylmenaquinone methyltransferase/2-methoxy-6-polyprenyl-1,4-benzoquinol methylase
MTCDKNPQKIQKMFDEISEYYDMMNNLISFGTHYILKFLALKELEIAPRTMILDLCCGSGDITKLVTKFYPRAKIIGLDFSANMLKLAKTKNPKGVFLKGDCTELPFSEKEIDYVTMTFGLRNVENRAKALDEIYRVLNYGGKFLHLDFGVKNWASNVFNFALPLFAKICKKDITHYEYLLCSKEDFPTPELLIEEFQTHGFKFLKRKDYLFGAISLQILEKN